MPSQLIHSAPQRPTMRRIARSSLEVDATEAGLAPAAPGVAPTPFSAAEDHSLSIINGFIFNVSVNKIGHYRDCIDHSKVEIINLIKDSHQL